MICMSCFLPSCQSKSAAEALQDVYKRQAVNAIETRDMPLLQGTVVFTTVLIIVGNLIADLLYNVLDPRIREGA